MSYGNWTLKGGVWVSKDAHNTQPQPTVRGITPGQGSAVHTGAPKTLARLQDKFRRFDKPSEDQINRLIKEDEEAEAKERDCTPTVYEAKKDLESGKIRVSDEIIDEKNKTIKPFASLTDGNGITHVLPAHKVPEKVAVEITGVSSAAPLPGERVVEQQSMIDSAMHLCKMNRELTRGRTV